MLTQDVSVDLGVPDEKVAQQLVDTAAPGVRDPQVRHQGGLMNPSNRLLRLTAQISLLIALLGVSAFLLLRVYLDDEENVYDNGAVTEVVGPGPATIGLVEWKLDSLQPYTKLVDDKEKAIDLDQPAGRW